MFVVKVVSVEVFKYERDENIKIEELTHVQVSALCLRIGKGNI